MTAPSGLVPLHSLWWGGTGCAALLALQLQTGGDSHSGPPGNLACVATLHPCRRAYPFVPQPPATAQLGLQSAHESKSMTDAAMLVMEKP